MFSLCQLVLPQNTLAWHRSINDEDSSWLQLLPDLSLLLLPNHSVRVLTDNGLFLPCWLAAQLLSNTTVTGLEKPYWGALLLPTGRIGLPRDDIKSFILWQINVKEIYMCLQTEGWANTSLAVMSFLFWIFICTLKDLHLFVKIRILKCVPTIFLGGLKKDQLSIWNQSV